MGGRVRSARARALYEKWTIYRRVDHYEGPLNSRHAEITSISHTTATLGTYPPHTFERRDAQAYASQLTSSVPLSSFRLPREYFTRPFFSRCLPRNRAFESSIYSELAECKIYLPNGPSTFSICRRIYSRFVLYIVLRSSCELCIFSPPPKICK